MSLSICLGLEWRRRFVSDLHKTWVQWEFVNEVAEDLQSKEDATEPRAWWHLHRHLEWTWENSSNSSTAFRKRKSPLTQSLSIDCPWGKLRSYGLWRKPWSSALRGMGRSGTWGHLVELMGAATSGPGPGTQQTQMLNKIGSGYAAEEAHKARDRFAIVLRQERLKWVPCERTRARGDWEVKEKGSLEACLS